MAGSRGQTDHRLIERLVADAPRYSFFEAVRLMQRALGEDTPRVGSTDAPARERIRFRPDLSFAFSTSDIARIDESPMPSPIGDGEAFGADAAIADDDPGDRADGGAGAVATRYEMVITFLGLYGTSSPLPAHFTEDLFAQQDDGGLVRRFLDILHHRLIAMFYRVWEKYRIAVHYDPEATDQYSRRLGMLLGLVRAPVRRGRQTERRLMRAGELGAPRVSALSLGSMLSYGGALTRQPRSAGALEGVLRDYFDPVAVEVEQCVASWVDIPRKQYARLGRNHTRLGQECVVGARVWDRACTFLVRVGPIPRESFDRFLPDGDQYAALRELIDLFNTDCLKVKIELVVEARELETLELAGQNARLGWSTWLGTPTGSAKKRVSDTEAFSVAAGVDRESSPPEFSRGIAPVFAPPVRRVRFSHEGWFRG